MENQENNNVNTQPQQPQQAPVQEGSTIGWGILGFFLPIVGLILFLVWKSDKPQASKSSGIGALIGVILSVIVWIIYFVVFANLMMSMNTY